MAGGNLGHGGLVFSISSSNIFNLFLEFFGFLPGNFGFLPQVVQKVVFGLTTLAMGGRGNIDIPTIVNFTIFCLQI